MKIAIFTQPLHTNFGGTLQAYALQKTLSSLGHTPKTINLRWSTDKRSSFRNLLAVVKHKILRTKLTYNFSFRELNKIGANHSKFIRNHLNLSPPFYEVHKMQEFFERSKFDAVIVGSDQVWRPKYSPNIGAYFFDFIPESENIIKFSYAASFGTDKWEFNDQQTSKFSNLLQRFKAVSVREISAVDICREKFAVSAQHVLDPTLLLEKEDYLSLIDTRPSVNTGKIFNYVLDKSEEKINLIKHVSSKLKFETFFTSPQKNNKEKFVVNDYTDYIYPEIEAWIKSFYDANFIVTDSFHGTVFSIIFNKKFIAISNEERGKARFISLLKLFGLEHRLVTDFNQISQVDLHEEIDFEAINLKLIALRKNSINFIESNLSH